ncbi:MAG: hypothetical protein PHZ11_06750 [Desulfitobacteriaceae bacterium]|nr:hypothetical protein [Desulfitobacteriaceae bacterium]MDD4346571.1 hypothetical protein [Desulfitobacteriaceae bacterium]MDD4401094.1 hypothetical protein [Desulfitobacteriaceae bacterium]
MRIFWIVLFLTFGLIGCLSPHSVPHDLKQNDSAQKSQEPEEIAQRFFEAQRTSSYSEAWNYMSPAYKSFWKSFEQYVDFMTKSKTAIPGYSTVSLENKFTEKKQDGPEHIMLWYQTTNNDFFFFNLIEINSEWKVYNTGGVLQPGDLPN